MNLSSLESTIGGHFGLFGRRNELNVNFAGATDMSLSELSYLDAGLSVLNDYVTSNVRLGLLSSG